MFRTLLASAATLALMAATPLIAAATPQSENDSDLELIACVLGEENATYSPALDTSASPTTISVDRSYESCLSVLEPGITSGATSSTFTRPEVSCLTLTGGGSRTSTIAWNTGQTSTLTGTSTSTIAGALLISTTTGSVTSGLFEGAAFVHIVTSVALPVTTCTLGLGTVPELDGAINLVITG